MCPEPEAPRPPAAARANAFYVLARCFDLPQRWPTDLAALVRAGFEPFGAPLTGAASRLADDLEGAAAPDAFAVAHARLFVGPFDVPAPPWASAYLEPDGHLMGAASAFARAAYAEAGLDPTVRSEPPDHVAFELEFMYYLAFREAETAEPVWRARQARFWCDHLARWLPRLAERVRDAARGRPAYPALAELTVGFAAHLDAVYGAPASVSR